MNPFLAGLLIVVALGGVVVTLEATDTTHFGLKKLWGGKEVIAGNVTAVVLSALPMEPGERLNTAKLWNAEQGTFNHRYIDREIAAEREYITLPQDVVGRVMARSKGPNQVFTEADFLPAGSPEGVLGLIPEGMEYVPLDPKKIKGIELLGFRDCFDLRVMVEPDASVREAAEEILKNRTYSSESERLQLAAITQGPVKHTLVQNGMVIRQPKTKGGVVTVALHPDDVDATIDALGSGDDIFLTARRGTPGVEFVRVTDATVDPTLAYKWILEGHRDVEFFHGSEFDRSVIPVGNHPSSPSVANQVPVRRGH